MQTDLDQLEEESFQRAYYADGLLDLLLGTFLFAWAILAFFDQGGMGGVGFALLLPLHMGLRKRITEPRVGVVKFRPQRQRQQQGKHLLLFGALTFSAVAGVVMFMTHSGDGPSELQIRIAPLPLGLMMAMMFAVLAWLSGQTRAYAYAAATVAGFLITILIKPQLPFDDLALALGLSSLLPMAMGATRLRGFLQRYPRA